MPSECRNEKRAGLKLPGAAVWPDLLQTLLPRAVPGHSILLRAIKAVPSRGTYQFACAEVALGFEEETPRARLQCWGRLIINPPMCDPQQAASCPSKVIYHILPSPPVPHQPTAPASPPAFASVTIATPIRLIETNSSWHRAWPAPRGRHGQHPLQAAFHTCAPGKLPKSGCVWAGRKQPRARLQSYRKANVSPRK